MNAVLKLYDVSFRGIFRVITHGPRSARTLFARHKRAANAFSLEPTTAGHFLFHREYFRTSSPIGRNIAGINRTASIETSANEITGNAGPYVSPRTAQCEFRPISFPGEDKTLPLTVHYRESEDKNSVDVDENEIKKILRSDCRLPTFNLTRDANRKPQRREGSCEKLPSTRVCGNAPRSP